MTASASMLRSAEMSPVADASKKALAMRAPLFPFDGEARTCQRHMFPGSRCELTDSWRLTLKCRRDLRKRNREDVMHEERCSLQG